MGNLEICKCGMTNNHPDFYSHHCEFSSANTPTTKGGLTVTKFDMMVLEEAFDMFRGTEAWKDPDYQETRTKLLKLPTLIEERCAERERLARIEVTKMIRNQLTGSEDFRIEPALKLRLNMGQIFYIRRMLDNQVEALQAQSGSQEENGQ